MTFDPRQRGCCPMGREVLSIGGGRRCCPGREVLSIGGGERCCPGGEGGVVRGEVLSPLTLDRGGMLSNGGGRCCPLGVEGSVVGGRCCLGGGVVQGEVL